MDILKPISELQNNFDEIIKTVHEIDQPIFFVQDNEIDIVLMSMEAYENIQLENEIYTKLMEATKEAEMSDERFDADEVYIELQNIIDNAGEIKHD